MGWEPGKPSQNEDEYFAKRDAEWMKARRAELDRAEAAAANANKALKCPRCGNALTERDFHNVKLDADLTKDQIIEAINAATSAK